MVSDYLKAMLHDTASAILATQLSKQRTTLMALLLPQITFIRELYIECNLHIDPTLGTARRVSKIRPTLDQIVSGALKGVETTRFFLQKEG